MGTDTKMNIVVSGDADTAQRAIDALVGIRDHENILPLQCSSAQSTPCHRGDLLLLDKELSHFVRGRLQHALREVFRRVVQEVLERMVDQIVVGAAIGGVVHLLLEGTSEESDAVVDGLLVFRESPGSAKTIIDRVNHCGSQKLRGCVHKDICHVDSLSVDVDTALANHLRDLGVSSEYLGVNPDIMVSPGEIEVSPDIDHGDVVTTFPHGDRIHDSSDQTGVMDAVEHHHDLFELGHRFGFLIDFTLLTLTRSKEGRGLECVSEGDSGHERLLG